MRRGGTAYSFSARLFKMIPEKNNDIRQEGSSKPSLDIPYVASGPVINGAPLTLSKNNTITPYHLLENMEGIMLMISWLNY